MNSVTTVALRLYSSNLLKSPSRKLDTSTCDTTIPLDKMRGTNKLLYKSKRRSGETYSNIYFCCQHMIITSCISFSYVVEQHHPEPTKYVGHKIEGEGLSKSRFLSVFFGSCI